ncbi:hypothetical protein EV426DRAFT_584599 [Tirmania nivea]|nr:hypothetical protein EV426DRAFT_584599 [Tirmania nivea]
MCCMRACLLLLALLSCNSGTSPVRGDPQSLCQSGAGQANGERENWVVGPQVSTAVERCVPGRAGWCAQFWRSLRALPDSSVT